MKETKHFVSVEQKINFLSITNAQLKISYIKQQSGQTTKQKLFGINECDFQKKYGSTISVFKNYKESGIEISKYIWKLKNNKIDYKIDWEIIQRIGKDKIPQSICSTCILEKVAIAKAEKLTTNSFIPARTSKNFIQNLSFKLVVIKVLCMLLKNFYVATIFLKLKVLQKNSSKVSNFHSYYK